MAASRLPLTVEDDLQRDWKRLRLLVQRETGCELTAADAVQEAYLRWFEKADRHTVENPGGYLYRMACNIARTVLRRSRMEGQWIGERAAEPAFQFDERTPERTCAEQQRLQRLFDAIENLPPRCREVFVLYRFHELDQGEIARRLGISRNMVERHVIRAMKTCRPILADN